MSSRINRTVLSLVKEVGEVVPYSTQELADLWGVSTHVVRKALRRVNARTKNMTPAPYVCCRPSYSPRRVNVHWHVQVNETDATREHDMTFVRRHDAIRIGRTLTNALRQKGKVVGRLGMWGTTTVLLNGDPVVILRQCRQRH